FSPTARSFVHDPVPRFDRTFVAAAVPGSANHRQADPSVVRRGRRRVDHVHGLLPDAAAGRIRLRALAGTPALAPTAVGLAHGAAGGEPGMPAHHRGGPL